jgi:hypothetical protein
MYPKKPTPAPVKSYMVPHTKKPMPTAVVPARSNVAIVIDPVRTLMEIVKDVVMSARDLERNYNIPGPERFKRVVRLRKSLDDLERRMAKGKR